MSNATNTLPAAGGADSEKMPLFIEEDWFSILGRRYVGMDKSYGGLGSVRLGPAKE